MIDFSSHHNDLKQLLLEIKSLLSFYEEQISKLQMLGLDKIYSKTSEEQKVYAESISFFQIVNKNYEIHKVFPTKGQLEDLKKIRDYFSLYKKESDYGKTLFKDKFKNKDNDEKQDSNFENLESRKISNKIKFVSPIEPLDVVGVRDIGFPISIAKTEDGGAAPVFFDRKSKSWKPAPSLSVGAVLDAEKLDPEANSLNNEVQKLMKIEDDDRKKRFDEEQKKRIKEGTSLLKGFEFESKGKAIYFHHNAFLPHRDDLAIWEDMSGKVLDTNEKADVKEIGWSEGVLSSGTLFRVECWAIDGVTNLTYFFPSPEYMKVASDEFFAELLEAEGLVKFLSKKKFVAYKRLRDLRTNRMVFSVNILEDKP